MVEVFMDDFSVYGSSFSSCLSNLCRVLSRCEETNLVLNWEKCHFMVKEGIVLGHKISEKGIEVDRAKIEVMVQLQPPRSVKDVRSFLGHAGFYRRFIKDFSKLARPMTRLLCKETEFDFDEECLKSFQLIKEAMISAPIVQAPNWDYPFEIMCDASDYAVGAVLGQKIDKKLHVIYYASRTMDDAQVKYARTEKELLAVVFAFLLISFEVLDHTQWFRNGLCGRVHLLQFLFGTRPDTRPHPVLGIKLCDRVYCMFLLEFLFLHDHLGLLETPKPVIAWLDSVKSDCILIASITPIWIDTLNTAMT
ncbi:unnamed protein product [Arabidopsis arenosa]|uniref:Reverse transcriptase/retrotransposon-derived protein RNase H-like domain-containing protein n=1 Tax=Arabidopsis arenosa TaxID=38785 RepID=A0A8S1ZLL0_ARAAE|nr:unnamed protein product [Arabidopsis arenosa]